MSSKTTNKKSNSSSKSKKTTSATSSPIVKPGSYELKTGTAKKAGEHGVYEVWFMQEGKETKGFQLPVNPESYSYAQGTNDKTVTRVGGESATIRMGAAPYVLSFSSYFPSLESIASADEVEVSLKKLWNPLTYVDLIKKYKEAKARIHVVIPGTEIDGYFRITSFKTEERGGDVGTIYYSITLKTCPKVELAKYDSGTQYFSENGSVENRPKKYKVKKGDTWKTIAVKYYGNSKSATVKNLKNANKKKGKVVKLKKGITIKLP